MDPSTSATALKLEIARLTGAINKRKSEDTKPPRTQLLPASSSRPPRSNVYVNPNYKPPSSGRPNIGVPAPSSTPFRPQAPQHTASKPAPRDVVIGGIAFQSSGRSLVRKDLSNPASSAPTKPVASLPSTSRSTEFSRHKPPNRVYKPKSSRGRPSNRNMTLSNTIRPFQSRVSKRPKLVDRPCPRFTTTGSCNRGLTCPYQHDPAKIAICWNFLQGTCPNSAQTCNLSHDPTPNRTPLCVHFANNGRCNRTNCPFPHVRVGQRQGVCRDFAVLGYCEKGLDCDKQHVRECPDFAEKGACTTKGCKLPHVIRANRNRAPVSTSSSTKAPAAAAALQPGGSHSTSGDHDGANDDPSARHPTVEDAQLGDEYISLTFRESDSEEDSEEESDEDSGEEKDEDEDGEQPQEIDDGDTHMISNEV